MKTKLASLALLILPALSGSAALPFVIDDFGGGPDIVNLVSLAPPEIALGSFAYGGAVGGVRDAVVISSSAGIFSAGVQFGTGGYASFNGTGRGGVVYDGVPGIIDANLDEDITAVDLDYGLAANLGIADCPPELVFIHLFAFTDLPGAELNLIFATGPIDYNEYVVSLTTVGAFADYYIALFLPDVAVGTFDPANVNAIIYFHDGSNFENLDIRVSTFEVLCVPEGGTWAAAGLLGILGLSTLRRR